MKFSSESAPSNQGGNTHQQGRHDSISNMANGTTNRDTCHPNSSLFDQLVQKRAGSPVLTTAKQFDKLNRLSGISSESSVPSVVNSASYGFNGANQRTRLTEADGKFWDFGYDALGQVTAGTKKLADSTPVLGHSFEYNFDTIGNLKTTAVNGQSATYTPDTAGLNQYASRTVPAALDILGTADAGAKVAVNLAPAQRQGDLFYKQLPVTNTSAAKWQPIDVLAGKAGAGVGGADADTRQSGHLFLAKTPESFTYDLDGNLTGDGLWSYAWDAENRLTTMETVAAAVTAGVPKQKLEFVYDFTGRRIQKRVSSWSGTTYTLASDTRFLYDGWNLLAEFNALSSNALVRSYVWGLDLSGSSQGAGGVGGLLAVTTHDQSPLTYFPVFDGNGNVTGLIDSTTGARSATYVYGPFGESIAAYGPAAATNPFGFSTKYTDSETGMLYYGFRYYNTSTGRWLSRDPIEEDGGVNLYGMVDNDLISRWDYLGMTCNPTFAIPQVVMDGMRQAWREAFLPNDQVVEQGGRVFQGKNGVYVKRDRQGTDGQISQQPGRSGLFGLTGNRRLADFHTHGYSKADGGHTNVSFSGDDIDIARKYSNGQAMYVISGDSVYILVIGDQKLNNTGGCAAAAQVWEKSYSESRKKGISVPAATETAVLASIKDCCMCYYRAHASKAGGVIPTTAQLVKK